MNGNFRVRCVDTRGFIIYTKGKVYDVINGLLTTDGGSRIEFSSFDDLQNSSSAVWELANKNDNNIINFKIRCIDTGGCDNYTKDKVYEVVNGELINNYGDVFEGIESFVYLQNNSMEEWKIVEEKENDVVNFRARCINNKGMNYCTTGKVYDIINSTLISDFGDKYFTDRIDSFKDLEEYSFATWELVENKDNTFKVRCVDTKGQACYTKGKAYNVKDGILINDFGDSFFLGSVKINSFEDLEKYSGTKWELIKEDKMEDNMGNFKVKCIGVDNYNNRYHNYTIGKIYNVVDGILRNNHNSIIFRGLKSLEDLQEKSSARWKLVEENKTKLTITINDELATISDGNDIIEVENNTNNEEVLVGELVKKYYYNQENNKIKIGDSVSITDTNCYSHYKEFIVDNAQELIDRMGLVEFSNLLLNFKSGDSPFFNIKYKVKLIAKHQNYNEKLAIVSDANSTFIINIDNLKKVDN